MLTGMVLHANVIQTTNWRRGGVAALTITKGGVTTAAAASTALTGWATHVCQV
jgi:hypothetical protein